MPLFIVGRYKMLRNDEVLAVPVYAVEARSKEEAIEKVKPLGLEPHSEDVFASEVPADAKSPVLLFDMWD